MKCHQILQCFHELSLWISGVLVNLENSYFGLKWGVQCLICTIFQFPLCKYSYDMLSRFSHVQLFVTLWTVAHQAPLSMGFSRQTRWHGLLFPSPGHVLDAGIEPESPAWAGRFFTPGSRLHRLMCFECTVTVTCVTAGIKGW